MKFVIVNDRAARAAKCARCAEPVEVGYLHEVPSRRFYCDHECYLAHEVRVVPIGLPTDSGIDGLPIGGLNDPYSFVFGS